MYGKYKPKSLHLKGNEHFEGVSIEREMQQATSTGIKPDRNITQIFYTQRKDGVLKETDIRTDRFDISQDAMQNVNNQFKQKIKEKLNPINNKAE